MTWSDYLAWEREAMEAREDDETFVRELGKQRMSTWTPEEEARYSSLTEQAKTYAHDQVFEFCCDAAMVARKAGNENIAREFEAVAEEFRRE